MLGPTRSSCVDATNLIYQSRDMPHSTWFKNTDNIRTLCVRDDERVDNCDDLKKSRLNDILGLLVGISQVKYIGLLSSITTNSSQYVLLQTHRTQSYRHTMSSFI